MSHQKLTPVFSISELYPSISRICNGGGRERPKKESPEYNVEKSAGCMWERDCFLLHRICGKQIQSISSVLYLQH